MGQFYDSRDKYNKAIAGYKNTWGWDGIIGNSIGKHVAYALLSTRCENLAMFNWRGATPQLKKWMKALRKLQSLELTLF